MIKKILKSRIFYFVLGAIIFGSLGAYAATVASVDISYSNSNSGSSATNVKAALDDLYSKVGDGTTTVKEGSFTTNASSAVTVTLGFKPRILFVYWVSGTSNIVVDFYLTSAGFTFGPYHVAHNNSDSSGNASTANLPNTSNQRINQITDTGFVFGKGGSKEMNYVAIK